MLTLLAVPLAYVNPRMGRSFNLVAAAFLYMLYSNCLNIVQSLIAQGRLEFWVGLVLPHAIALLVVVLLFRHQLSVTGLFRRLAPPGPDRHAPRDTAPMKTLKRYIGRDVLLATLLIFVALLTLFAFFDLIHELGDVGRGDYTISRALLFVMLNMPSRLYELFPVAALIGTLFADRATRRQFRIHGDARLGNVARAGRMVGAPRRHSARGRDVPRRRIRRPARGADRADGARGGQSESRVVAQQFESGFWFKQDLTFVNIRTVLADMSLVGMRMYEFERRSAPQGGARRAVGPLRRQWRMEADRRQVDRDRRRQRPRDVSADVPVGTVLRPSILNVYQVAPESARAGRALRQHPRAGSNAQKTSRFEIAFWNKMFYPAAVLVMMVLALPFAHFQRRQGGIGFRIFAGTMIGLSFFLLGRLFSNLGLLNDWPPLFSAAFPLAAFTGVALGMLWWMERR